MKEKSYSVLIADDEENVRVLLEEVLTDDGYRVIVAKNGKEAFESVKKQVPDCVLLDVRMPVMDGMEAFLKIKEIDSGLPVIFITAYGSSEIAINAMKQGAYDYLTKPFNIDEIKIKVKKAIELREITIKHNKDKHKSPFTGEELMVGESQGMQDIYKEIGRIADTDANVLIRGESGTGKELVAKAIHINSNRKEKPYIVVNCAAIPESLLESELFGHEKGAFTDAVSRRIGKFEEARDGTIFLDEIGDMSLNLQSKLLRVLQEKTFSRVGSNDIIRSEARVIAATNRDLESLVKNGNFREDLYYRLNVVTIFVPPLRDRKEDIPLLSSYFIAKYSKKYNKQVTGVTPEVIDIFLGYDWPGNVRELENVIARSIIVANASRIVKDNLPTSILKSISTEIGVRVPPDDVVPLPQLIEGIEKEAIIKALQKTGGNKSMAAKLLGISRKSLINKIRQYAITSEDTQNGRNRQD